MVNNELVVREIAICIRLIDIFMENDAVYNMWLDRSFSGKLKFRKLDNGMYELDKSEERPISDFPVYVNIRNEQRFFRRTPIKDAQAQGNRESSITLRSRFTSSSRSSSRIAQVYRP